MKKIELMHDMFGVGMGLCRDCSNLKSYSANRKYFKCMAYGDSNSEATDWRQKWSACGMKNKSTEGMNPIYKNKPTKNVDVQIEGQMTWDEFVEKGLYKNE